MWGPYVGPPWSFPRIFVLSRPTSRDSTCYIIYKNGSKANPLPTPSTCVSGSMRLSPVGPLAYGGRTLQELGKAQHCPHRHVIGLNGDSIEPERVQHAPISPAYLEAWLELLPGLAQALEWAQRLARPITLPDSSSQWKGPPTKGGKKKKRRVSRNCTFQSADLWPGIR